MEIRVTSENTIRGVSSFSAKENDQLNYMEMTKKHLNEIMSSAFTQRPIHETFMLELKRVSEGYSNRQEENEELGTKVGLNIVSDLQEIEELKKNLTK